MQKSISPAIKLDKKDKEVTDSLDQKDTAYRGVKWKFNPPGAPHFGGINEAMIKSANKATCGVLGSSDVTDEELITAVAGVKSLLNSRALTYQSLTHLPQTISYTDSSVANFHLKP